MRCSSSSTWVSGNVLKTEEIIIIISFNNNNYIINNIKNNDNNNNNINFNNYNTNNNNYNSKIYEKSIKTIIINIKYHNNNMIKINELIEAIKSKKCIILGFAIHKGTFWRSTLNFFSSS
jgi:hypothetical protein